MKIKFSKNVSHADLNQILQQWSIHCLIDKENNSFIKSNDKRKVPLFKFCWNNLYTFCLFSLRFSESENLLSEKLNIIHLGFGIENQTKCFKLFFMVQVASNSRKHNFVVEWGIHWWQSTVDIERGRWSSSHSSHQWWIEGKSSL